MRGFAGVPYGQEIYELITAMKLQAGCLGEITKWQLEELAYNRARQVGRFYLNATGAREGANKPSPFVPENRS